MSKTLELTISNKTILKILLTLVGVWFFLAIKEILAILFFALILSSVFDHLIEKLVSNKIPRFLSVLTIYITLFSTIAMIGISLAQPITTQTQELIRNFPNYYERLLQEASRITGEVDFLTDINFLSDFGYTTQNIFTTISNIFGGLTAMVLIMVLTFYMSVQTNALKKVLNIVLPPAYQPTVNRVFVKIYDRLGSWLKGQVILSLIVTVCVYIGLTLIGVNYALILAILAGVGEFIPYLGPMIASLTGVLISFIANPILGIITAIFYACFQFVENHILVPKIMQKAIGLNPILIICSLIIGIKVGGVIGALLAIPSATVLMVILEELYSPKSTVHQNQ